VSYKNKLDCVAALHRQYKKSSSSGHWFKSSCFCCDYLALIGFVLFLHVFVGLLLQCPHAQGSNGSGHDQLEHTGEAGLLGHDGEQSAAIVASGVIAVQKLDHVKECALEPTRAG
jgi:hypothetical protein